MKILKLYLYDLRNSAHWEFIHTILGFALNCLGITTHLKAWLAPFQAAAAEEDRLMQISLKNVITSKLAKLDGQRDGLVSSIKGATNALLKSLDADVAGAAEEVMNELTSLRVDIQDDYSSQTGQIDTLVAVLLSSQRANVELLGLLPLVQRLKDTNDLMHDLMTQRAAEQFDRMNDTLAAARLVTDSAYGDLTQAVESYVFLHAAELSENDLGFTQFINDTNARVEYFRRYVLKLKELPDGADLEGPDETTPNTPPNDSENSEDSEDSENSGNQGGGTGSLTPDPDAPGTNPNPDPTPGEGNDENEDEYTPPDNDGGFGKAVRRLAV